MATIFNNSRWLPLMRSNMVTNAPHHLYKNLKFSELSEFYEVRNPPPTILHINYCVREPHVSHTGINVCAHCPLHLPKIVSKKPSVNHIGSSSSHQLQITPANVNPVQVHESQFEKKPLVMCRHLREGFQRKFWTVNTETVAWHIGI